MARRYSFKNPKGLGVFLYNPIFPRLFPVVHCDLSLVKVTCYYSTANRIDDLICYSGYLSRLIFAQKTPLMCDFGEGMGRREHE